MCSKETRENENDFCFIFVGLVGIFYLYKIALKMICNPYLAM